jgi:2-dehydro-3-deoxygluconokinase
VTGIRFVAVGECMVELFGEDPVPVAEADGFRSSFGGDALQAALAASNLGTPSAVATVAGDDAFAHRLVSWMSARGLSAERVVRRPGFTGLYLISIDVSGERSFVYYRAGSAASTLAPADLGWDHPPEAVLVSGITQGVSESSRAAAFDAARRTGEAGGLTVYDVNHRPGVWGPAGAHTAREAFEEILPLCDVVRAAAPEETILVAEEADAVAAARALAARGPRMVLVGCGAAGAVLAQAGTVEVVRAPRVACVDTTGAGDALNGGFIHGLLEGLTPLGAARLGVTAGSMAVTRRGGASSMPTGEEVRTLAGT